MKKYEILGGNLPVVVCELSAGESMITESGSMSWMSPNMKMETISGGGMKKMFGRLMSVILCFKTDIPQKVQTERLHLHQVFRERSKHWISETVIL